MQFDNIVIGGGTAGSIIAARLSEDPGRRVLLLEAGPDYPDILPPELLDTSSAVTRGHNWDTQAFVQADPEPVTRQQKRIAKVFERGASYLSIPTQISPTFGASTTVAYPIAKVVGGGSAINGCLALHAPPEDYAKWADVAGAYWNYEQVTQYIRRIATADDHKPALSIETPPREALTVCQKAFLDSCIGFENRPVDLNRHADPGVGIIPKSVSGGRRISDRKSVV